MFNFNREIAIDLGTANTIIMMDGQVVVNEPSVVALKVSDDSLVAVGKRVNAMVDRGEQRIRTVRPLKDGVIADYKACELMLRGLIAMLPQKRSIFSQSIRMVVCVPSGSTDADIHTIKDSCERAGARDLYLIYEPMAAALGIGIDIEEPEGCMVVDIGGGTTEIAVMSLGSLVVNESIKIAGDAFNKDIIQHMDSMHNMRISAPTAERIKKGVGAVLTHLENAPDDMEVVGPNRSTDLPLRVRVNYTEIAECLDNNVKLIEEAIMRALGQTPSELYADIVAKGIYLTGGGALLKGLAQRIEQRTSIHCNVAEEPLLSVASGTAIALSKTSELSFLISNRN